MSRREREIIDLQRKGATVHEIAHEMGIPLRSVRIRLRRIATKLQESRNQVCTVCGAALVDDAQKASVSLTALGEGERLSVVLFDRDVAARETLRPRLERHPNVVVLGEARTSEDVFRQVAELHPHVVFMDDRSSRIGTAEAIRGIHEFSERTRVILLCAAVASVTGDSVSEMLQARASGYLIKQARVDELVNAARLALEGKAVIHPALTQRFFETRRRRE